MIYTAENTWRVGRPVRVFVDGDEIDSPVYADTDKGIVRYYPVPYKVVGDEILTKEISGVVTVEDIA